MKKSILAVLLAVALVAPVFASTSSKIDVVGKIGVAVNPSVYCNTDDYDYRLTGNAKNNFMVSLEGLYNLNDKIAAGIGLNYIFATDFDTSIDDWFNDKMSIGFTNIYATIKPKLSDSIYAIAQLGYGIPNFEHAYSPKYWDVNAGGIYGGLGAGIEYKSFIFEALYSMNSANMKCTLNTSGIDYTFRYSTLSFNVGYKFSL